MKSSTNAGSIVLIAIFLTLSFGFALAGNEVVNAIKSLNTTNTTTQVSMPQNCSDFRNCVENCIKIKNCTIYQNSIQNCTTLQNMTNSTTRTTSVIFGLVKDRNGHPVPQARVSFTSGPVPLPDIAALTDINGAFALSASMAGIYVIEVFSENFAPTKTNVSVANGQEVHIEIHLP